MQLADQVAENVARLLGGNVGIELPAQTDQEAVGEKIVQRTEPLSNAVSPEKLRVLKNNSTKYLIRRQPA